MFGGIRSISSASARSTIEGIDRTKYLHAIRLAAIRKDTEAQTLAYQNNLVHRGSAWNERFSLPSHATADVLLSVSPQI